MRTRAALGMAAVALVCGTLVAAVSPGTALAMYAPNTLTANDIKSATTIQLGKTLEASVTNANSANKNNTQENKAATYYCTDTSVVRFYKLVAPKDGDYCFYSTSDYDMWCGFYTWDGTSAKYSFKADDEGTGSNFSGNLKLKAGEVCYAAACAVHPYENWTSSFTFSTAKKAASVSLATVTPGSPVNLGLTKVTFTYADKTSEVYYMRGRNDCCDNYGNVVDVKFSDSDAQNNYDDCALGTYKVAATLRDYDENTVGGSIALDLSIVDETKVVSSAKDLSFGTSMTPDVYKFTARADGIIWFNTEDAEIYEMSGNKTVSGCMYLASKIVKGKSYFVNLINSTRKDNIARFYTLNDAAAKSAQTITAKVGKKTYKVKKLKKKKATFKIGASAKTAVTYKVVSGKKFLKVSKAGAVTVKKGAKKGTYKIKVTAAANGYYKAATKIITVKVK